MRPRTDLVTTSTVISANITQVASGFLRVCMHLCVVWHVQVCVSVFGRGKVPMNGKRGGQLPEWLAGLEGCYIIFGRVVPSLWRASVKSTACRHHQTSPSFSASGSRAKPSSGGSLAAPVAHNAAGPAGPYTAQTPRALHTERRWPDHLLALITAGVQQVDQRVAPSSLDVHT